MTQATCFHWLLDDQSQIEQPIKQSTLAELKNVSRHPTSVGWSHQTDLAHIFISTHLIYLFVCKNFTCLDMIQFIYSIRLYSPHDIGCSAKSIQMFAITCFDNLSASFLGLIISISSLRVETIYVRYKRLIWNVQQMTTIRKLFFYIGSLVVCQPVVRQNTWISERELSAIRIILHCLNVSCQAWYMQCPCGVHACSNVFCSFAHLLSNLQAELNPFDGWTLQQRKQIDLFSSKEFVLKISSWYYEVPFDRWRASSIYDLHLFLSPNDRCK